MPNSRTKSNTAHFSPIGDSFSGLNLPCATGISIVNFKLFPENPKIQNIFRLKNGETAAELFDAFELHYIELIKVLDKPHIQPKTPFERWIHILKFSTKYLEDGTLPECAKDEEGIPMAMQE